MNILLFFCVLLFSSCSTSTRQLFFDIPMPSQHELEEKAAAHAAKQQPLETSPTDNLSMGAFFNDNRPRPEVESIKTWEVASEALPKDYKKDVDWSAALEQGLVRPRAGLDPKSEWAAAFKYDFIIAAEKSKNDAFFPHSAHTAWLGCKNCHMSIYPNKRNPVTMREMKKGASCGTCHGKVAFSLKQCKRCHLNK